MEDTGLHEVLSTVYAPNAVNNMLHGKAVLRAVRGHFLLDAALNALLMSDTFHVSLPESDTSMEENSGRQEGNANSELSESFDPEKHGNKNGEHLNEVQGHVDSSGLEGDLKAVPVVQLSPEIKGDITVALKEFEEREDLESFFSL